MIRLATSRLARVSQSPALVPSIIAMLGALTLGIVATISLRAGIAGIGLAVAALLIALRARRVVLVLTLVALILGNSSLSGAASAVFYVRFALFGLLTAINLLEPPVRRLRARAYEMVFGLLAVGALGVVSVAWSPDRVISLERSAGFILMVAAVVTTATRGWSSARALRDDIGVLASVVVTALAIGLALHLQGSAIAQSGSRFQGILENPNTVALAGALVLPLCFGLAATARGQTRSLWSLAAVLVTMALFMSGSRNGLLSGTVGIALAVVRGAMSGRARRIATVSLLVAGAAAAWAFLFHGGPAGTLAANLTARGSSGRLGALNLAARLIAQKPLTGWGFGTTQFIYGPQVLSDGLRYVGADIPSGYLEAFFEGGVLSLVALLVAVGRPLRLCGGTSPAMLSRAIWAAVVAGAITQLFEAGITAAGSLFAFIFWLLVAALAVLDQDSPERRAIRPVAAPPEHNLHGAQITQVGESNGSRTVDR
ncbi:MAG: O-antigen ligase family protein [Acidimicrobiales bacterium]